MIFVNENKNKVEVEAILKKYGSICNVYSQMTKLESNATMRKTEKLHEIRDIILLEVSKNEN